jgi:hypothetical protein
LGEGAGGGGGELGFPPVARPFAGVGTFVGGFGAVIEAVGVLAGVAAEREKVELAAEWSFTVAAQSVEVGGVHLRVGWFWRWVEGRHVGWLVRMFKYIKR